jgi:hypothetical protein
MTTVKPRMRARAVAKVTVHSSEAKPYYPSGGPGINGDNYKRSGEGGFEDQLEKGPTQRWIIGRMR